MDGRALISLISSVILGLLTLTVPARVPYTH